jgi:hypothetical protein
LISDNTRVQATALRQYISSTVAQLVERVCRYSTEQPGFAVIDLGPDSSSRTLRKVMVEARNALDSRHRSETGRTLDYYWVGRFDQQSTTKFHRDNAPEESILLLGYEPTSVQGTLWIADYTKTAQRLGFSPREFMEMRNPMFVEGERAIGDDVSVVREYNERHFQLLAINNSEAPPDQGRLLGVLHKAEITNPDSNARRIINSVMLACSDGDARVTGQDIQTFLETDAVSQRDY